MNRGPVLGWAQGFRSFATLTAKLPEFFEGSSRHWRRGETIEDIGKPRSLPAAPCLWQFPTSKMLLSSIKKADTVKTIVCLGDF